MTTKKVFEDKVRKFDEALENTTLADLAQAVKWEDVRRSLKYFFPEDQNDYLPLLTRIKNTKPGKQNKNERLVLSVDHGDWPDNHKTNCYYSVSIKVKGRTGFSSVSFRPWGEIFNMLVEKETLNRYVPEDIIAQVIWELTFYGNEEDTNKTFEEITGRIKAVKNNKK